MKVAMLLQGSVSDQAYNTDGQRSADLVEKKLGLNVTVTQNVPLPNQTNVYSQFARQGYNLVIGWGGQFTDGAVAASRRFPKTQFLVVNSNAENGSNVSSTDVNFEMWNFVAGYAMARLTKSNVVGYVGGQCFPSTAVVLNGTRQGAEYANKGVQFLSTFTGDFEDPTKAQQAAQAMIDKRADVLTATLNQGFFGIIKAAQNAGHVKVITEWADNHSDAPAVIATSILKSQGQFLVDVVKRARDEGLGGKHYQFSLSKDAGPVLAKTPLLPDSVYQDALKVQKQVASGEIKVKHLQDCPR